jgi:predicted metal-dependent hydrolase
MSKQQREEVIPEYLKIGQETLPLMIKRHASAKRICLRYNPTQHAISLTLPRRTRVADGLQFLLLKSQWLIDTLQEMPSQKQIKPGVVIPLMGRRIRIKHDASLRGSFKLEPELLTVGGDREFFPRRVTEALKKISAKEISKLAERDAAAIGRRINRITVRDTRSRWGSCSSTGNLSFSWRLVFAPKEVMEYVVAHEVAHLRHMNHSPAFWAAVERICSNYEPAKVWLRLHGKHLYRFNA